MKVNITNLVSFLQSNKPLFFSDSESFIMKVENNLYIINHSFYGEELHYTDLKEVRFFIKLNSELFTDCIENLSRTKKVTDTELSFNDYYEFKFDTNELIKLDITLDIMKALHAAYIIMITDINSNFEAAILAIYSMILLFVNTFIASINLSSELFVAGTNELQINSE